VQSSAGTLVDPLPPQGPVELVARYAEQPREGRRAGIAVAPAAGEGRGKRLRREVGRLLRVPGSAREIGQQPLGVSVIEDPERLGIPSGLREQFSVGLLHHQ
jgi:hypothetical protein